MTSKPRRGNGLCFDFYLLCNEGRSFRTCKWFNNWGFSRKSLEILFSPKKVSHNPFRQWKKFCRCEQRDNRIINFFKKPNKIWKFKHSFYAKEWTGILILLVRHILEASGKHLWNRKILNDVIGMCSPILCELDISSSIFYTEGISLVKSFLFSSRPWKTRPLDVCNYNYSR